MWLWWSHFPAIVPVVCYNGTCFSFILLEKPWCVFLIPKEFLNSYHCTLAQQLDVLDFTAFAFFCGLSWSKLTDSLKMDFIPFRFVAAWLKLLHSTWTQKLYAVFLVTWTSSQINLTQVWSDSVFWKVSQQFIWKTPPTFRFDANTMDFEKSHSEPLKLHPHCST